MQSIVVELCKFIKSIGEVELRKNVKLKREIVNLLKKIETCHGVSSSDQIKKSFLLKYLGEDILKTK